MLIYYWELSLIYLFFFVSFLNNEVNVIIRRFICVYKNIFIFRMFLGKIIVVC